MSLSVLSVGVMLSFWWFMEWLADGRWILFFTKITLDENPKTGKRKEDRRRLLRVLFVTRQEHDWNNPSE